MNSLAVTFASFWYFLKDGYLPTCSVGDNEKCSCEAYLYLITGTFAVTAGLIQWTVGYHFSMAELSDSVHAFSDSFADYTLMLIVFRTWFLASKGGGSDSKASKWRANGNSINATLLVFGALVVIYETSSRIGVTYPMWLPAVAASTSVGLIIDLIRMRMLSRAKLHYHSDNIDGAIFHAMSDAVHSMWATMLATAWLVAGVFFSGSEYTWLLRATDLCVSFGLAYWMMFILAPSIWKGKGCCGQHEHSAHQHGPGCKHHH